MSSFASALISSMTRCEVGALPGRAVVQLARIRPRVGDVARRGSSPAAAGFTTITCGNETRWLTGHEVLFGVVRQLREQEGIDRHRARRAEEQRRCRPASRAPRPRCRCCRRRRLRFSTFTARPRFCDMLCATWRATTSTADPAANGLISVTGRDGQSCCAAACGATAERERAGEQLPTDLPYLDG